MTGKLALLLCAGLLLGGCASTRDRVILLPNAGGGVGKVAVLGQGKETVIDAPYASAETDSRGGVKTAVLEEAAVRAEFARELTGLPPRPVVRDLYFVPNTVTLAPASEAEAAQLLGEIAKRPAVEVVLIGHTDTRGSEQHNEQLSLLRAMLVRARLVNLGVSGFRIRIAAQGERLPAIATPDNVDEPRNRRVEIQAR